jgi:NAD(P)-dependent dehydrogenase (short-subunit alcohol dehydrogenase family)
MKWTAADVQDQTGRVAIITGANTGIGYETAAVLARRGADVVPAVRNIDKGEQAAARITAASPHAKVAVQQLDLTSLASVSAAADAIKSTHPRIDLLINIAGAMMTPKGSTKDGFELQFGTNHLGHFALTGMLLDHLLPVDGSRVLTISSLGHRIRASINLDDLRAGPGYDRAAAYGRSKLDRSDCTPSRAAAVGNRATPASACQLACGTSKNSAHAAIDWASVISPSTIICSSSPRENQALCMSCSSCSRSC